MRKNAHLSLPESMQCFTVIPTTLSQASETSQQSNIIEWQRAIRFTTPLAAQLLQKPEVVFSKLRRGDYLVAEFSKQFCSSLLL